MSDISSIELQIDKYIFERGLAHGSRLPPPRELAGQLLCQEEALVGALRAAEQKRKVIYDQGDWVVLSAVLLDAFSFTKSAVSHGHNVTSRVLKKEARLPLSKDDDFYDLFSAAERTAHEALGLKEDSRFLVIERFRLLDGQPSALQRVYLAASRFPPEFLELHNFERESLIDIYQRCGFNLLFRNTILSARTANFHETTLLMQTYKLDLHPYERPVVDAEQRLYAQDPGNPKNSFVLEFLKASYFMRYEINHRPPG